MVARRSDDTYEAAMEDAVVPETLTRSTGIASLSVALDSAEITRVIRLGHKASLYSPGSELIADGYTRYGRGNGDKRFCQRLLSLGGEVTTQQTTTPKTAAMIANLRHSHASRTFHSRKGGFLPRSG